MVYKYDWRTRKYPIEADVAGKHIEELQNKHGEVTSKILLDSARSNDSCIHSCFEWKDDVAAEKYRLQQASEMLCDIVKVSVADNESEIKTFRAFVNVSDNKLFSSGKFVDIQTALSNEETRKIVLNKALNEFDSVKKKYEDFTELSQIFKEIESAKRKYK